MVPCQGCDKDLGIVIVAGLPPLLLLAVPTSFIGVFETVVLRAAAAVNAWYSNVFVLIYV